MANRWTIIFLEDAEDLDDGWNDEWRSLFDKWDKHLNEAKFSLAIFQHQEYHVLFRASERVFVVGRDKSRLESIERLDLVNKDLEVGLSETETKRLADIEERMSSNMDPLPTEKLDELEECVEKVGWWKRWLRKARGNPLEEMKAENQEIKAALEDEYDQHRKARQYADKDEQKAFDDEKTEEDDEVIEEGEPIKKVNWFIRWIRNISGLDPLTGIREN